MSGFECSYQFLWQTRIYPRNKIRYKSALRAFPTKRHLRLCDRNGHLRATFSINRTAYCCRCHREV